MAGLSYRLKRFDLISPKFPVEVRKIAEEWAFETVNEIKLRLTSGKPPKIETGNLRASVRFDLKGGVKAVQKNKQRTKVDTLFVRFLAGSGETLQEGRSEGFLVPYATQREKGGMIVPKTARKIFVPVNRSDRGMGKIWRNDPSYVIIKDKIFKTESDGTRTLVATLHQQIFQKPQPYMFPTIEKQLPKFEKSIKEIKAKDVETPGKV